MENASILATDDILCLTAIIIFIGMISGKISDRFKLPDVVLFLIAGIIIGPSVLNLASIDNYPVGNQLILTFGSAFILYDGGREIKLKVLNDVKITVALLSVVGVIVSAFGVGILGEYIFNIPFIYALLIGSVIASTDPATLVPVFKEITIKDRIKQTVISESAFNDAAGAMCTFAVLGIIQSGKFSLSSSVQQLVVMLVAGTFAGIVVGIIASLFISRGKLGYLHNYAPLVSVVAVIGAYLFAERIHGSGYMATFILGLICGNKDTFRLSVPEESHLVQSHVRETLSTVMRMGIFILLGTHVDFISLFKYWKESLLIVFVFIFIVRPICVLVCALPDRKIKWTFKEMLFMMWVRETGVIPAALAGMLVTMDIPYKGILSSVVFMTILITLLGQASTTKLVAQKLNLLEECSDNTADY